MVLVGAVDSILLVVLIEEKYVPLFITFIVALVDVSTSSIVQPAALKYLGAFSNALCEMLILS